MKHNKIITIQSAHFIPGFEIIYINGIDSLFVGMTKGGGTDFRMKILPEVASIKKSLSF